MVQFYFLACVCLVFPTFIEETVLSPLYILGSFVINELTIYVLVCFYTLLYSIDLSIFMPIPSEPQGRRNINNLRYAENTSLMAEIKEPLDTGEGEE